MMLAHGARDCEKMVWSSERLPPQKRKPLWSKVGQDGFVCHRRTLGDFFTALAPMGLRFFSLLRCFTSRRHCYVAPNRSREAVPYPPGDWPLPFYQSSFESFLNQFIVSGVLRPLSPFWPAIPGSGGTQMHNFPRSPHRHCPAGISVGRGH